MKTKMPKQDRQNRLRSHLLERGLPQFKKKINDLGTINFDKKYFGQEIQ